MTVKSLRKQLAAAIAMTLVATVALGSSTYAWFVSNNQVTATTASISAQSNAPFLVISNEAIAATTTDTSVTTEEEDAVLFPVQMIAAAADASAFTWQSAYATASNVATEKTTTRFTVQAADYEKYYLKQTFHVGTNGTTEGQFKNLRVSGVTVTPGAAANNTIAQALRIMVVCGEEVAIYDQTGTLITQYTDTTGAQNITGLTAAAARSANGVSTTAAYLTLEDDIFPATSGEISDKTVDVYLYYDGAVAVVTTDDIDDLGSVKVTLTFTADDAAAPTN